MKRLAVNFIMCFALIAFIGFSVAAESSVTVKGSLKQTSSYIFESAYIQLVKLLDSDKPEIGEIKGKYDIDNRLIAAKYVSHFPEVELSGSGEFKFKVDRLESGWYMIAAQNIIPKSLAKMKPRPLFTRPLAKAEGKHLVIEIPKKGKTDFSLDLGEVIIPLDKADMFVKVELKEPVIFRP